MVDFFQKNNWYFILGVLSILLIISCESETVKKNQIKQEESINASKSVEQFKVFYTSVEDREAIIGKLVGEFYWYIHTDLGFNADIDDEIEFDVVDNKEERSMSIMIDDQIVNRSMSADEIMWANAFGTENSKKTLAASKEKLYLQCSGGSNDSKTLIVDRPTDIGSAETSGGKMAPFIDACLKGGGCVLICKSKVKISKA